MKDLNKWGNWLTLGMIIVGILFTFILWDEARSLKTWGSACENITKEKDFCSNAEILCSFDFSKYKNSG